MKTKRVAYKKEPKLHIHKYVCLIHTGRGCKYFYEMNLKEVNQRKKTLKSGQVMEVFKADHNYIKAWMAI